ncbi:hypothetical protein D3C80_1772370 [compost metagenome]
MPSRLSIKLLIQRPMSPVSSDTRRRLSRRWRRLPSPSAMVRITSVMPVIRVARRFGPKVAKHQAPASNMPPSTRSNAQSGRPLKCWSRVRMTNSTPTVAR